MNCLLKFNLWFRALLILSIILLPFVSSKLINFNNKNDINIKNNENDINIKSNKNSDFGKSHFLIDLLSNAFRLLNLRKVVRDVQQGKSSSSSCMSCKFGIAMAQHLIEFGKGKEEIASIANYLCKTLNVETDRVCEGFIDQFKVRQIFSSLGIRFNP
jgi:hypothetical protein